MKVWIENVNKSDGKKLVSWWNANTKYYHFIRKHDNNKLYDVMRQI